MTYQDWGRAPSNSTAFADGLVDSNQCRRDILFLQKLGVNTILVWSVITTMEHANCMRLLEDAGIYLILILNGLNEDALAVDGQPMLPWDYTTYRRFFARIDTFHKFSNTLAFAFELTDRTEGGAIFTPELKAVVRDMKEYIANRKYRAIPVGSFEYDHMTTSIADYMRCGNSSDSVDFHGVKTTWTLDKPLAIQDPPQTYEQVLRSKEPRCLNASIAEDRLVGQFRDYPIPTLIWNGCEAKYNHTFDEVSTIYRNLSSTFSGIVVADYFDRQEYDRGKHGK
jgi:hypothetical protein